MDCRTPSSRTLAEQLDAYVVRADTPGTTNVAAPGESIAGTGNLSSGLFLAAGESSTWLAGLAMGASGVLACRPRRRADSTATASTPA